MTGFVHINGRLLPAESATVSVFDRGLNYGDGLFETMKARLGRIKRFSGHIERLRASALALGIPTAALDTLADGAAIMELLEKNGLKEREASVKVVLTRGLSLPGHLPPKANEESSATLIITARAIDSEAVAMIASSGVSAVLTDGPRPALPMHKTLNFLPCILAKAAAEEKGAYEGIFTTPEGLVTEGSSTNIFIVKDNCLKTPPAGADILSGVTRGAVIDAARGSVPLIEAPLSVAELKGSDEALLTNSIIEVVPLLRVDAADIGGGRPGPVTRLIQSLYETL